MPICLKLLEQLARRAFSLALAKTGNKIAASIAIIAMTTRSSIKVKPLALLFRRPYLRTSLACPTFIRSIRDPQNKFCQNYFDTTYSTPHDIISNSVFVQDFPLLAIFVPAGKFRTCHNKLLLKKSRELVWLFSHYSKGSNLSSARPSPVNSQWAR